MAHINIKPIERSRVYDTSAQAIGHLFLHSALKWDFGGQPFGRTIEARRAVQAAVKAKDASAFRALRRRGYWRVELVASA